MKKVIILLLFISFVACTKTTSQSKKDGWATHKGTNYSIKYPSNWNVDLSGQMGVSFVLFSPQENTSDIFKENVNLVVQNLAGMDLDLDKYIELSENQIQSLVQNPSVLESTRIKNDKTEYHKLIYSGDYNKYRLTFEQYLFVIQQKAYVLTFTAEQSKFSDYKQTAEKILNSFLLKK